MNALQVEGVTKKYTNHTALDQVSLSVPEKTIFGLLGPNGAGKTTLIRIINQIISLDDGKISIFNEPLHENHVGVIGYLPEERGLYKKLKVGEQLLYLAQLKGLSRQEAQTKIKAWLTKFDIVDWTGKKVEDLSKGMAQKVQFISTVMHEPKLIILDEPFSGFDPVNANLIRDEILELKEKGSTIIFSTHRMETVEELCDHIVLIDKAKKILEGPKKEIKNQYKSFTFAVDHIGSFQLNGERYEIIHQNKVEENTYRSLVRMKSPGNPNDLLKQLIEITEVHSFIEKIPSMSEIFIQLVKGGSDE